MFFGAMPIIPEWNHHTTAAPGPPAISVQVIQLLQCSKLSTLNTKPAPKQSLITQEKHFGEHCFFSEAQVTPNPCQPPPDQRTLPSRCAPSWGWKTAESCLPTCCFGGKPHKNTNEEDKLLKAGWGSESSAAEQEQAPSDNAAVLLGGSAAYGAATQRGYPGPRYIFSTGFLSLCSKYS